MMYGQLAEGDRLLSVKTGRWYEVTEVKTVRRQARIRLARVADPLIKSATEEIPAGQVRRGDTGQAMDLFITIFSGEKP